MIHYGKGSDDAMLSNGDIHQNTGIVSDPGIGTDMDITRLHLLFLARTNHISGLTRVIDDHDIGRDTHMILNHNPVTSADDAALRDDHIISDKKNPFLRVPVLWVEVNAGVSIHSDVISEMHISGPVDHHPRCDVDIFSIRSKKKPVFEIAQRIPEPLFLH